MERLEQRYTSTIRTKLKEELGLKNIMQVPKLDKIVVNIGVGEAIANSKALDNAVAELTQITGQKPQITRARKSISNFKLREGMAIGCRVTLRGSRMFEFMERLINLSLPRVRDFRGISNKGFDGRGNYTLGIRDQIIFPEIDFGKIEKTRGMNISFVTTAETDDHARKLLTHLGLPFRTA